MLRVIVSVLAAFVGFSFGHSIPKWMESRQYKSATGMQSPSLSEPAPRTRKYSFRKKSLRKFKVGLQKPGKDNVEGNRCLHTLCDNAEVMSHEVVQNSADDRMCKELKKLKFRAQRLSKDESNTGGSNEGLHSSAKKPLCAPLFDSLCLLSKQNGGHDKQGARNGLSEVSSSSQLNAASIPPQDVQGVETLQNVSNPVACCKILESMRDSPTKEKSQMKQWKMKLMSLRSKAMASEKVWYEKFDNEGCGGKVSVSSPTRPAMVMKKTAKGKENESPQVKEGTKKRDFFWCRSSSRVGLLVEGDKSGIER